MAVAAFPVQDPEDPDAFPVTFPVRFAVTVVAVIRVVARVSVVVSKVNAVSPSSVPSPVQTPIWLLTGVQTFDTSHPADGVYASKALSPALRRTDCPAHIASPYDMSHCTAIVVLL